MFKQMRSFILNKFRLLNHIFEPMNNSFPRSSCIIIIIVYIHIKNYERSGVMCLCYFSVSLTSSFRVMTDSFNITSKIIFMMTDSSIYLQNKLLCISLFQYNIRTGERFIGIMKKCSGNTTPK